MSDITNRIRNDPKFLEIMWQALMVGGTLYDGKERIVAIVQGTLAKGDCQEALQLGTVYKGSIHDVSASSAGVDGPWLAHTHGEVDGQKYHPPSLADILVTIQRAVDDQTHKGISVVIAIEGFYILYPMRTLITRLQREPGYDRTLAESIKAFYPEIFTNMKAGDVAPEALSEALKKYDIVCEFIPRPM